MPRYLIRVDDVCPTMNWRIWDQLEGMFMRLGIQPLIAVVPDNRDPALMVCTADDFFWERVAAWAKLGWIIGQHGYQHVLTLVDGGVLRINRRSEFAGLPISVQRDRIRRGRQIMVGNGVEPSVWVAPAHSFDRNTLEAVREEGFRIISDGLTIRPTLDKSGLVWIPQQLWRPRVMPFGFWTICIHPNSMTDVEIARLYRFLRDNEPDVVHDEFWEIVTRAQRRNWWDYGMSTIFSMALLSRRYLRRCSKTKQS